MKDRPYIHGTSRREQERLIDQAELLSELLAANLDYQAGDQILEIGCGVGAVLGQIGKSHPDAQLHGIDISHRFIDLAVEVGFERLSEVPRQILALCEAAHIPTIWATQVLESLAKTGQPSRAEITDAAAGQRAECVMLNKGPHIVDAIRALDDIMLRMGEVQVKSRTLMRRIMSWDGQ